jgi:hypothetical protein
MAVNTVTSASVGTVLTTGAGSITAMTMNQPTSTATDLLTQLVLVDAAAAPTATSLPPHVLFAANLTALACLNEPKPNVPLTPGMTAPTWPKSLGAIAIAFTAGCYVKSCPANVTFTVTC